jgi:hypothetical protein
MRQCAKVYFQSNGDTKLLGMKSNDYKFAKYYKIAIKTSAVFILPILITVNTWSYRNYIQANIFEYSTFTGYNIYWFFGQYIEGDKVGLTTDRTRLHEHMDDLNSKSLSLAEKVDLWKYEGLKLIIENPIIYLKVHTKGLVKRLYLDMGSPFFLTPDLLQKKLHINENLETDSIPDLIQKVRPVALLYSYYNNGLYREVISKIYSLIWYITLYLCCLVYFLKINNIQIQLIIIISLILFFWNIPGPLLNGRYRAPMEPLLIIFSMQGLWLFIKGTKKRIIR